MKCQETSHSSLKKRCSLTFFFFSKIDIKIKLNVLVGTKGAAVVGYVTKNKKKQALMEKWSIKNTSS